MKKKRDGKARPTRDLDGDALAKVQGGAAKLPGEQEQHNETFVRARRRR